MMLTGGSDGGLTLVGTPTVNSIYTGTGQGYDSSNNLAISTYNGGRTWMYISSSGNVGIGTTTPASKLELNQSASGVTAIAKFGSSFQGNYVTITVGDLYAGSIAGYQNAGTKRWELTNGGDLTLNHPSSVPTISGNGQLRLSGPTTVAVTAGNFLVGTTTDSGYKLDVSGSFRATSTASFAGLSLHNQNRIDDVSMLNFDTTNNYYQVGKSKIMVLKVGSEGADVKKLQEKLGVEAIGKFGPKTEAAVKQVIKCLFYTILTLCFSSSW